MRFDFDPEKSRRIKADPQRGIIFQEQRHSLTQSTSPTSAPMIPKQFRAIGWVGGALYSVVYEVRYDVHGEFYHLVTLWKATKEERRAFAENIE